MEKDYSIIVENRELNDHFHAWINLATERKQKRVLLTRILDKKHYYDKLEAFGVWKKDVFFKTMVSLVNQIVIQPQNHDLLSNVFKAWHRVKEYEKVRERNNELADANYQYVQKREMFSNWKEISEPNMSTYLTLKRGINKISNVMLTEPYFHIISINEKEKAKEDKVFYLLKRKQFEKIGRLLQAWRQVNIDSKLDRKNMININNYFKESQRLMITETDQESELTFELTKPAFKHPEFSIATKPLIQITCMKSFGEYTEPTTSSLLKKYFIALKHNCKTQKVRKEQFEYSSVYYCRSLKSKFIRKLVNAYNDSIDEHENDFKAKQYYYQKQQVNAWMAILEGVKNSKKEKLCEDIHVHNLKLKTFKSLAKNVKTSVKKRQLQDLLQVFQHNRTNSRIKHCYYTWKHRYDLDSYYVKVVSEFEQYRTMRFKRSILKALEVQTKNQKRLRELEVKATDYFKKKTEFRLICTAFNALNKHSTRQIFTKNGQADELALHHRLQFIGKQCFDEWRKQTKQSIQRQKISEKHAIFSAWKHFAKQSSLVKKYLNECDGYGEGNYGTRSAYKSGNYENDFKSPVRNELKCTSQTVGSESPSPINLQENRGMVSQHHPNVLANTDPNFKRSKYY